MFIIFESRPLLLDIIMPLNESRPRKVEIDFECFLDIEQFFILYILQELIAISVGFGSVVTIGTFLLTLGKHFCASYRLARLD